jgi:hypothetical protein
MYENRRIKEQQRATERLGFKGYLLCGKQIVPVEVAGVEIPTVVGYLLESGIVIRKSSYAPEQKQIRAFERRVKDSGLCIVDELSLYNANRS